MANGDTLGAVAIGLVVALGATLLGKVLTGEAEASEVKDQAAGLVPGIGAARGAEQGAPAQTGPTFIFPSMGGLTPDRETEVVGPSGRRSGGDRNPDPVSDADQSVGGTDSAAYDAALNPTERRISSIITSEAAQQAAREEEDIIGSRAANREARRILRSV